MSYDTRFNLDTYKARVNINEILEKEKNFEGLNYAIDSDGSSIDRVKWYTHEDDMKKLSKKYSNIIFVLEGVGQDDQDIWIKYFKDSKMQVCKAKITFDEYDENKLE